MSTSATSPLAITYLSAAEPADNTAHRGRSAPRSRNGCWTCRGKAAKKRCDEQRPVCGRCQRGGLVCDYAPRQKRPTARPRQRPVSVDGSTDMSTSSVSGASPDAEASGSASSPDMRALPLVATSSSSLTLTSSDHEALRYFRTTFAQFHHTKHPQYGCISIMFGLARDSPMVMHMALALGFHEMDARRQRRTKAAAPLRLDAASAASVISLAGADSRPTQHYAAALRLLASVVGDTTLPALTSTSPTSPATPSPQADLDACLSTLWLMLLYEQQFGDPHGRGLAHHLRGAALLAQHKVVATSAPLSLYTVRMLVWIAHIDAAAAAAGVGLGGFFDRALIGDLLAATQRRSGSEDGVAAAEEDAAGFVDDSASLDLLVRMHRYSNPLYRVTWASAYPQAELLDDLANRSVFHLFTCCGPLRRMVAVLAGLDPHGEEFHRERERVGRAIRKVRAAFGEVLDVARALSMNGGGNDHNDAGQPRGLVANLRIVVPTFYAVEVEFAQVTGRYTAKAVPITPTDVGVALGEILRLAFQTHRQGGDAALTRIAWPLFVAALETADLLHRQWILERFAGMAVLGDHLQRAHQLLADAVLLQERTGQRADVRAMMPSYGAIVLT